MRDPYISFALGRSVVNDVSSGRTRLSEIEVGGRGGQGEMGDRGDRGSSARVGEVVRGGVVGVADDILVWTACAPSGMLS